MQLNLSWLPSFPVIRWPEVKTTAADIVKGDQREIVWVYWDIYMYYVFLSITHMSSPTSFTGFILEVEIPVLRILNRSLEEWYFQFYIIPHVYTTFVCFGCKIWRLVHHKRISECKFLTILMGLRNPAYSSKLPKRPSEFRLCRIQWLSSDIE